MSAPKIDKIATYFLDYYGVVKYLLCHKNY